MQAHRHLYSGNADNAMRCALRLTDFEDVLYIESIYMLLALAAFKNLHYGQCSKAFIKLETDTNITEETRTQLSTLN